MSKQEWIEAHERAIRRYREVFEALSREYEELRELSGRALRKRLKELEREGVRRDGSRPPEC